MQPENPMTLKDWIITLILLFLPLVGFIMLIIWAFDKGDPRNHFAKAYLIVSVGIIVIVIIFYILLIIFFLTTGIVISNS